MTRWDACPSSPAGDTFPCSFKTILLATRISIWQWCNHSRKSNMISQLIKVPVSFSQPTFSQQLRNLRRAKLIKSQQADWFKWVQRENMQSRFPCKSNRIKVRFCSINQGTQISGQRNTHRDRWTELQTRTFSFSKTPDLIQRSLQRPMLRARSHQLSSKYKIRNRSQFT